jgi:hypothetical protein
MLAPVRLLLVCFAACGLMAQAMGDLNSLVLQASRYADHETARQGFHRDLALFRIIGTSGDGEEAVMRTGLDLQQWTLVYLIEAPAGPPVGAEAPQSVSIQCTRGMLDGLHWSPLPVFDAKSLQWAWIAISLDDAIGQLNRLGYTRGFSNLTIMRPLHPRFPDECTFVFKCPLDHAFVGISAQTGKKLWTEPFPY